MKKLFIYAVVIGIIIILFVGYRAFFVNQSSGILYQIPGTIFVSDHTISLKECLNTSDAATKAACAPTLAIQLKDRTICQKVFGNTDKAYYCQEGYDAKYGYTPPSISQCQSMTSSSANGSFYKDNCFRGIAEANLDPSICKYLSEGEQSACVVQVNNDAYAKKNLCGPLFVNGNIPGASDCVAYVESLNSIQVCNLLTRAQGPDSVKQECIQKARH